MVLFTTQALCYVIALIAIAFTSLYLFIKHRFNYWKNKRVPYIKPSFPFGNFESSVSAKTTLGEIAAEYYNDMKKIGHKYFGIYFFHNPAFMLVDPDLVKSVMARDFAYFYDRGVYHDEENDPLTATLFSLEGQKWKNLRAKLTPTFTSGKMKKMFQTLVDCSVELKDCLNEPIRTSEPVDIKQISVQYTTDVIGSCAFGIECNSFKDSNTEFIRSGKHIFSPTGLQRVKLFLSFIAPWLLRLLKIKLTHKDVDHFYRNLVKDTIEYREKNNIVRNDFMQLLIQLKNKGVVEYDENDEEQEKEKGHDDTNFKFTLNSLSAQAFIFFIAGFETSSTTMTWAMYELAQNTEVQNKAREEIVRVLKKHGGNITYDAMMEMHYLERVIQEALRKYPPITVLQRVVTADYTIPETDGIVLEKGTTVFIPIYAIQKDPEFYPEPEKFDPDRFTEENKRTRPDYTWLPFGEGPRVCIGLRFGMMQVKVGLCQLLLNYKFTLNPKSVYPATFDPHSFVTSSKDTLYLDAQRVTN